MINVKHGIKNHLDVFFANRETWGIYSSVLKEKNPLNCNHFCIIDSFNIATES